MPRLCIVTALPAESRPLLDTLKLRQAKARHLRLYSNEQYLLLETGMGKLNAAASVGALLQAHSDIGGVVNLGIAGGCFDYGRVVAAHHIQDQASGAQWFPHIPDSKAFRAITTARVSTLDAPDSRYRPGVLFDMEAAGVFNAASRYLSSSQVHSIKVVSDNPDCDIEQITKKSVVTLVEQAMPSVVPMLEELYTVSLTMIDQQATHVDEFIRTVVCDAHHSVNDEQQLRQLVQRYFTLEGTLPDIDTRNNTAKGIRQTMHTLLAASPFLYDEA